MCLQEPILSSIPQILIPIFTPVRAGTGSTFLTCNYRGLSPSWESHLPTDISSSLIGCDPSVDLSPIT
jgi:hypothetical protein